MSEIEIPTLEPLASPPLATPWVPLWPLAPAPPSELGYAQIVANASVPVVVEASAATIITVAGVVCDGTPVIVEFAAAAAAAGSGGQILVNLWLDSADQGRIVQFTATSLTPLVARTRLTPAAGTHTFTARVWSSGGATGTIYAGAGGVGVYRPAFLRITRA